MGQRTQIILKIKDKLGRLKIKVYHEQWGYGKTMPMLIVNFLTSVNYGKQSNFFKNYKFYNVKSLSDYNNLSENDKEEYNKNCILNFNFESWDVTNEYENCGILPNEEVKNIINIESDTYTYWLNNERQCLHEYLKERVIPLLNYDFDIKNINDVKLFIGDNNDGLALVSVEEKVDDVDISIGFLSNKYDKWLTAEKYMKQYKNYNKTFNSAFKNICKVFEVKQIGEKLNKTIDK